MGVPLRVGSSAASPRFAAGFPLLPLTRTKEIFIGRLGHYIVPGLDRWRSAFTRVSLCGALLWRAYGLTWSVSPLFLRGRVTTCYCILPSPRRFHQRSLVRFGKGPASSHGAFLRGRARAWLYHLLLQASISLWRQGSLEKAVLRTGQPFGAANCTFCRHLFMRE
jgi:hypothetical protein